MTIRSSSRPDERRIREAALDETLANSFPASDPPSSIPNPYEVDGVGGLQEGEADDHHTWPHVVGP